MIDSESAYQQHAVVGERPSATPRSLAELADHFAATTAASNPMNGAGPTMTGEDGSAGGQLAKRKADWRVDQPADWSGAVAEDLSPTLDDAKAGFAASDDPDHLADLLNQALVEQAERHGVDLG